MKKIPNKLVNNMFLRQTFFEVHSLKYDCILSLVSFLATFTCGIIFLGFRVLIQFLSSSKLECSEYSKPYFKKMVNFKNYHGTFVLCTTFVNTVTVVPQKQKIHFIHLKIIPKIIAFLNFFSTQYPSVELLEFDSL